MVERSLLKYGIPKQVGETTATATVSISSSDISKQSVDTSDAANKKTKQKEITVLPPINANRESDSETIQDILDCILPPNQWEENGKLWMHSVSSVPATRLDVINLQEEFDAKLLERQAKPYGICPIRRELYDQCFDELLRQVTINCAERGLLLMRVRDEVRMTLAAYDALYESSVAFGVRKALGAEEKNFESELEVGRLKQKLGEVEEKVEQLEFRLKEQEEEYTQHKKIMKQRYLEDTERLKKANQQLKARLIATKPSSLTILSAKHLPSRFHIQTLNCTGALYKTSSDGFCRWIMFESVLPALIIIILCSLGVAVLLRKIY